MMGTMTSPDTASAHQKPKSAFRERPISKSRDNRAQRSVCRESATSAELPSALPTLRFAFARIGITHPADDGDIAGLQRDEQRRGIEHPRAHTDLRVDDPSLADEQGAADAIGGEAHVGAFAHRG